MCLYAHMSLCTQIRVRLHTCIGVGAEDDLGAISWELLTLVLEAGSLTDLGSWLGPLGSPGDPPVCASLPL